MMDCSFINNYQIYYHLIIFYLNIQLILIIILFLMISQNNFIFMYYIFTIFILSVKIHIIYNINY